MNKDTILVTGGAGFIGSNFILDWIGSSNGNVVNVDKLTYAANRSNLKSLEGDQRHTLVHGDICDVALITSLLEKYRPRALVHFAAESHVDRSILAPGEFVTTNVNGTFSLLEAARAYWGRLDRDAKMHFRFLHVSTDEVYGSLGPDDPAFNEITPYAPNSPYSASKAASDHFVRAYHHTYGIPTLTTNCSNNYGPFQFPEKLIPLVITNALAGQELPIYGDGMNIRDWLYVSDHCAAVGRVIDAGRPGETYNIGGWNEKSNVDVVHVLCDILNELVPHEQGYRRLIRYVSDRPGHDRRYAIDASKIERELGWRPAERFETGIRKTVQWYLGNQEWIRQVRSGAYAQWVGRNYGNREQIKECA